MNTAKAEVESLLQRLPDDCTMEDIQYHLYVIALNRYLRLRLPGYDYKNHFGGVYYIFMRGVDPDIGLEFGIFRDRPAADFIDKLSESLIH